MQDNDLDIAGFVWRMRRQGVKISLDEQERNISLDGPLSEDDIEQCRRYKSAIVAHLQALKPKQQTPEQAEQAEGPIAPQREQIPGTSLRIAPGTFLPPIREFNPEINRRQAEARMDPRARRTLQNLRAAAAQSRRFPLGKYLKLCKQVADDQRILEEFGEENIRIPLRYAIKFRAQQLAELKKLREEMKRDGE